MVEGLTDAQIVERVQRLERNVAKLADAAGVDLDDPAAAVDMTVTNTDPGLKGDTASGGGTKPATLESGVVVQVPLFVNEGDRVRVDTRSGEYVSRA